MEPFVVVASHDDAAQVPFRVPVKGKEPIEFTIPRLQFLTEAVARQMKSALLALDAPVPMEDEDGQPVWERDASGEVVVDEAGEKVQAKISPQRTVHETTRATAEAMLKCVTTPAVFKKLQGLTVGELDQIISHWTTVSSKPVESAVEGVTTGESSASSNS